MQVYFTAFGFTGNFNFCFIRPVVYRYYSTSQLRVLLQELNIPKLSICLSLNTCGQRLKMYMPEISSHGQWLAYFSRPAYRNNFKISPRKKVLGKTSKKMTWLCFVTTRPITRKLHESINILCDYETILPGPVVDSATLPPHRSPCNNDGSIVRSLKKFGTLCWSLDQSSLTSLSPYWKTKNSHILSISVKNEVMWEFLVKFMNTDFMKICSVVP